MQGFACHGAAAGLSADCRSTAVRIRWRNAEAYKYIIVFQHITDDLFYVSNKIASMENILCDI